MTDLVYQTIGQLLDEQTKKYPKREALVYANRDLRMTYEELNRQSRLVARGLMALGIEKGDHIAVWTTNVPEWVQ